MFDHCDLFDIPKILIESNFWKTVLQMNLNALLYGEHKEYRLRK